MVSMTISVFDLFKIGIGPSSSHTMGPMRAAARFVSELEGARQLPSVTRVTAELYGSLALTGIGHGTDKAILLGLEGERPDEIDPDHIEPRLAAIRAANALNLGGKHPIGFAPTDLIWHRRKNLPHHPNGMKFTAYDGSGTVLEAKVYYSIGGGFVVDEETAAMDRIRAEVQPRPFPFHSGADLLALCDRTNLTIAEVVFANERAQRSEAEIRGGLQRIWQAMRACMDRGLGKEGVLPGSLKVKRRAAAFHRELLSRPEESQRDPLTILDWVNLYALAVNEENASGARVVTAPTNGAAGIIPAVGRYFEKFVSNKAPGGIERFLLTAAAIGILYAENASISGAEVGCQGEIGVACSMAAGGLVAAMGGRPRQVEQAAEIGMEHNLGLTCDPIGGLVQIPCIERNAMGAVKAINAARIAMMGDGSHYVSLDSVIKTMRQTGKDMMTKYKETSRGGLAVNVTEC